MKIRPVVQIVVLAAVSALAGRVSAGVCPTGTQVTYQFTGQCTDCTGTGIGRLTLQNYTLGTSVTACNFVGLTYTSNLISFTITPNDLGNTSGSLPVSLPGPASIQIIGSTYSLVTDIGGEWIAGKKSDSGFSSSWSLPASGVPTLSVPAIFSLALMLAILGVILVKRFPSRRSA